MLQDDAQFVYHETTGPDRLPIAEQAGGVLSDDSLGAFNTAIYC